MAFPVTDASYATPTVSHGVCLSTTSILCQIAGFNTGRGLGVGYVCVCWGVQEAVKLCGVQHSKQAMLVSAWKIN